jgi:TRAP-type mannitol/chloroaromatic compound transport system permease small subunit
MREKTPEPVDHEEPDDLRFVVHHTALPETGLSRAIDDTIKRFGSAISWVWLALMAVIVVNVFMKNALGQGSVRFEEIQWHIYAALFLLGLSYTMAHDDHVRVDVLHERFGLRAKAWVDLVGIVLFLIPFILVLLLYAVPYVAQAFEDGERSASPAGLSNYWIIKSALPLGFGLLLLTALARVSRCWAALFGGRG